MSAEVGKAALDFLVRSSGNRHNLEVDFFGGEPTMNFGVVKEVVEYGRSLEKKYDKHFRFTLTTNGILLNDEIMECQQRDGQRGVERRRTEGSQRLYAPDPQRQVQL